MKTITNILLFYLLVAGCTNTSQHDDQKISSQQQKNIIQYSDSLSSDQVYSIDTLPELVGRSIVWLTNPLFYDTLIKPKVQRKQVPKKVITRSYLFDSIVVKNEDYKPPIVQEAIIKNYLLKEPQRQKILQPHFRDNATIDVQVVGETEGLSASDISSIFKDSRGMI